MTIVVNGMCNKALGRLMLESVKSGRLMSESVKNGKNPIEFIGGVYGENGASFDVFFSDDEWKITTGTCNDAEFVEIKNVSGDNKFMFVLTSGEFDSLVIA